MVVSIVIGVWACAAQGEVTLSDGTRHRGEVELPVVRLFVPSLNRQVQIDPRRIALLRTWVEKEELLQAWTFVEEGSPKKIPLGENYPLRNYATEVFLDDGQVLRGHVMALSFDVALTDEDLTFALRATHKGAPGQAIEDLTYVREIKFGTPPPAAALARVTGTAPGATNVYLVRAEGGSAFAAPVGKDGKFRCEDLITGTYRAVVRGPRAVAAGLAGEATRDDVRAEILAAVAGYREFFEEKKVLALAGNEVVWVFVGLARAGKTSAGESTYARCELWRIEKRTPRWEIRERVYLWREILAPGAAPAWPAVAIAPGLAKIDVKAPETALDASAALEGGDKGGAGK
jgi:hypothetical protein